MSDLRDQTAGQVRTSAASVFMQQVYVWMTAGLLVTAGAAYITSTTPAIMQFFFGSFIPMILLMVAIFGLVIYLQMAMPKLSAGAATGFFLLYAGLMGIFLGPTLLVFTKASVVNAFVVSAGMFAGMSVLGAVTKRDLTGMGSFMIMGLWGIILASIVNIFLGSSTMNFVISVVGVIVFAGLTAYDTQRLRVMGESAPMDNSTVVRRGAIMGALALYLDFINMFLMLLQLFGNRE